MNLEEKLKIKKFTSEWHKATINIIITSNWLLLELEKRANKKDLTFQQFNVLRILKRQYPNPATNYMLKERLLTTTPDISRLVDRIVAKKLVSRCKNASDKRAVDLVITDLGLQLLEEIEDDMMMVDLLSPNITEEECVQLYNMLYRFRGETSIG